VEKGSRAQTINILVNEKISKMNGKISKAKNGNS
jgi:hypothetical protein